MAPVMSMCRASARPGQSLLNSRGSRSQPRSVAAHATPDERCNAAIATLSAASLLVGAAAPAMAVDLGAAPSPAAVVAGQPSSSKMVAGVAAPSVLFETADLNADVRDTASGYRDPAISTPQDNVSDKVPSTSNLPDLSDPKKLDVGGVTANAGKTLSKGMFGSDKSSALPANPLAAVADLNADVRDAADSYRDPAIATPQDNVAGKASSGNISAPDLGVSNAGDKLSAAADDAASKAKSLFSGKASSALPANPLAAVADQNADVRDAASGYRDPAGAVQLDAASDALKKAKSQATGSDISGAASDAADKAKGLFSGNASSALPANPLAAVADQNADVRDAASGYRDPAGAVQLDAASDALKKAKSQATGSDISGAASDAADKAKGLFSGKASSALPANPLAAVADQNADVRDAASGYRDPAGAVQLDAASDALKKAKSQATGSDISGAASDAADKAKGLFSGKASSALPANPLAAVADQNADVRDAASGYRDPAGAVQLDAASDALKKAKSQATGSDISGAASDAKDKAKSLFSGKASSALPANPLAAVADQNADVRDAASGYRDPAGAVQLDAASDALKKAKSQATGSDISGAASDAADKAKGLFSGKASSALPANPLAAVADQNADVRDAASGYRDPAGAVQLDAASDALKKAKSQATGSDISGAASDAADKAKGLFSSAKSQANSSDLSDAASDAKSKAKSLFSSAKSQANSSDLSGAASDAKSKAKSLFNSAKSQANSSDLSGAASDAKAKAKGLFSKGVSALPANPLAAVADQNRDVRGDADNYRDPAGAVQQDNAAGAAKSALKGNGPSVSAPSLPSLGSVKNALKGNTPSISAPSVPSLGKASKQIKKSADKLTKQVDVSDAVNGGKPVYPISGAKLNKPLVQNSVGGRFN